MAFRSVLAAALAAALVPLGSCRVVPAGQTTFYRGLWITRWDFKSADDVRRAVRDAAELGFDHVLFQVRGNADALYRSSLEPWSEELGGKDPGFDPLEVAVAAGRSLGLGVHAWVNAVPGWRGASPPRAPGHLWHTHPEWFLVGKDGKRQALKPGHYVGLNICLPEVRAHIVAVCRDIAARYDVDGIHLDYIRFIEREKGEDYPFDPRTLALFRQERSVAPADDPARWDEWRRECVNRLVQETRAALRAARPRVRLSAAVFRDQVRARREVLQDPMEWARQGWVDSLYPMNYEATDEAFTRWARESLEARKYGVMVLQGIGAYRHLERGDLERTARQVEISRELGGDGVAIFSWTTLFAGPAGGSRSAARQAIRQRLLPLIR